MITLKLFFRILSAFLILAIGFCLVSCNDNVEDEIVELNMNTDFRLAENLPQGNGERIKVILLLGQSNASGSSIVSYLEKNSTDEDFARYSEGYSSVLINYCIDDHNACSDGEFVKVDLTCGAADGFFGPELGMADALSKAYPDLTMCPTI